MSDSSGRHPGRLDRFRGSALPVAAGCLLAAGLGFGLEATLPGSGLEERRADPQFEVALRLRAAAAVLLSLATLWLARGLWLDRGLVAAPDDRLASEYLGAGLLAALFSAMTGAVAGVAVTAGLVAGVAAIRRRTADPLGTPARDLRNAAVVTLAGSVGLLGVPEAIRAWARWRYGFGAEESTVAASADRFGLIVLEPLLLVVAAACALTVPAVAWWHRRRLSQVRGLALIAGGVPVAAGALAGSLALLVVGGLALAFVGALLVRSTTNPESPPPDR
ncbi:MAG: hypothetical protein ACRCYQ_11275 [Nocardioides sp.]